MSDVASSRIIYQVSDAPVSVLIPCECGLTLQEIGIKDVPAGVLFWIVSVDDLPAERTFRNAWELDVNEMGPSAGVGAAQ